MQPGCAGTRCVKDDQPIRRRHGLCWRQAAASWLALLLVNVASGQEAIRTSIAGQEAAEARKRALADSHYNLKLGPVSLRFQSGLGIEATDNVKLVKSNPQADLLFQPQANAVGVWPVSEKNSLNLSLGVGYVAYLKTTEYNNFFIAPGSDVSFDLYINDFIINFHDRFSYSQDVSNDPTVSGTGSLEHFENVSGIQGIWDLNKLVLGAGYDHSIYIASSSESADQNRASDLFNLSAGVTLNPTMEAGLQVGGGFTTYDEKTFNNNSHIAVGPFFNAELSEYSTVRLALGYVAYFMESNSTVTNTENVNGMYGDLTFRQRVNANLAHSISGGRQITSGSVSDIVDLYYARYSADWKLLRKTSLGISISYEHAIDSGGTEEKLDRYGVGISLSRALTQQLSSSVAYQFYQKEAEPDSDSYVENRLVLNLNYAF